MQKLLDSASIEKLVLSSPNAKKLEFEEDSISLLKQGATVIIKRGAELIGDEFTRFQSKIEFIDKTKTQTKTTPERPTKTIHEKTKTPTKTIYEKTTKATHEKTTKTIYEKTTKTIYEKTTKTTPEDDEKNKSN